VSSTNKNSSLPFSLQGKLKSEQTFENLIVLVKIVWIRRQNLSWFGVNVSYFIKNIFICVPKMNEGLRGLERHKGEK